MSSNPAKPNVYLSNGRILEKPPFKIRFLRFIENVYFFFGLYVVSFFSIDPYAAAVNSQFNITHPDNQANTRRRWGSSTGPRGGGGGGGGGPEGGPGGPGPKRIGQVDDIRGPECKSCG